MSILAIIIYVLIAAVCGALGRAIAGDIGGGFLVSTVVGFIGALVGPWIAHKLHLAEPFVVQVSGHPFPIVWSIVGAAVFVAIIHLLSGR